MKNFKVVAFVVGLVFVVMMANAAAQNLGEVVFQQTINTAEKKSLLYHFVAKVGNGFDTALSLSNVRTNPITTAPTPGSFTIYAVSNTPSSGGTVTVGTADQLTNARYNTITVGGKRGLVETASFFLSEFLTDRGFTSANFVGYMIINHAFPVGTGVANAIDFASGVGFNISYAAAQYDRTATTPTTNTKE
ncbi:MAG: hypothetical protein HY315_01590 [Acidobacteria bacterium]|nr:hypothetical protein [Acidobacteriota bacterium]